MAEYVSQQDVPVLRHDQAGYASVLANPEDSAQLKPMSEVSQAAVVMDKQYVPAVHQQNGQKIYAQTSTHTMSAKELRGLHEAGLAADDIRLELPPCLVLYGVVGYTAFLNGTYHRIENASHERRYRICLFEGRGWFQNSSHSV
eukprot:m.23673 g.23673  ORF g.23673 m.23673 type:complete len:144 (+) comp11417_c1_seq4:120-551(+)